MRINRQKKVGRILRFYSNNFGFRKPYQVLVDGTFCNTALQNKINITEQLLKYFGGEVKLLTTPCVILEMEKLGSVLYGATLILKQFPVHQCGHKTPILAATCLKNMIGRENEFRYILATQDRDLQRFTILLSGVPLLYIFKKAPILRPPNDLSVQKANQHLHQSCNLSVAEEKVIKKMKKKLLESNRSQQVFKKSKKKGGPNPLSCKKKKNKPVNSNKGQVNKKTLCI